MMLRVNLRGLVSLVYEGSRRPGQSDWLWFVRQGRSAMWHIADGRSLGGALSWLTPSLADRAEGGVRGCPMLAARCRHPSPCSVPLARRRAGGAVSAPEDKSPSPLPPAAAPPPRKSQTMSQTPMTHTEQINAAAQRAALTGLAETAARFQMTETSRQLAHERAMEVREHE